MGSFDREQLETLKRQIEDDYRLDISAIERLMRRFVPQSSTSTGTKEALPVDRERSITVLPTLESQGEAQPDDLTNTLRGMFSSHRR